MEFIFVFKQNFLVHMYAPMGAVKSTLKEIQEQIFRHYHSKQKLVMDQEVLVMMPGDKESLGVAIHIDYLLMLSEAELLERLKKQQQ